MFAVIFISDKSTNISKKNEKKLVQLVFNHFLNPKKIIISCSFSSYFFREAAPFWPFKDSKVEAKRPLPKAFLRMVACLQMVNTKHMVERTMDNILNRLSLVINKVQTDSNNQDAVMCGQIYALIYFKIQPINGTINP